MTVLTLEEILIESFQATKYPASQATDKEELSTSPEMQVFGKMSIPSAHLYHWIHQCVVFGQEAARGTNNPSELQPETLKKLTNLSATIEISRNLMTRLIFERFPAVSNADMFFGLKILPDWQVAGIYLTAKEREANEAQQEKVAALWDTLHKMTG